MSLAPTRRALLAAGAALALLPAAPGAQDDPLRITVAGGEFRPIALAAAPFAASDPRAQQLADQILEVALADLTGSGLFRVIPRAAYIEETAFDARPSFGDWRAVGAEALLLGRAALEADGRLRVEVRLFDVASGEQVEGLQFFVDPAAARRVAHKIADAVYARLTGEGPYFDSRILFVDETGPKNARVKRLALMDQDGANLRYLTSGSSLALTPRFSPTDQEVLYISYETGEPQVFLYDLETGRREALGRFPGMSFAPRFSPDGRSVAFSIQEGGNADIHLLDLATRRTRRLTRGPAIDTAPSFSPDGRRIVFESDRGGGQQLYVMEIGEGDGAARRISFGDGRYGTPVWSPRGDLIAFTKQVGGEFQIGVMRPDGTRERILDRSYHVEGPTWAPNGRVLSFFKEAPGESGRPSLWSIDVTGRNLKRLETPNAASDPAWSPLLP
jgi:TolB protein